MRKKTKKAQQLIEFALVLPIIVALFMILMDVSIAMYDRMVFSDALKMSVAKANQSSSYGGKTSTEKTNSVKQLIEYQMYKFLNSQNMPYAGSISVTIEDIPNSSNSIVIASFKYNPYFSWANSKWINVLPSVYTFTSTQVINNALLRVSSFETFTTKSSLDQFNSPNTPTSILNQKNNNYNTSPPVSIPSRNLVAFLVGSNTNYANLYNWTGDSLLPANLRINIQTGFLNVKSPYLGSGWQDTSIPYSWVLASLGISQAIFVETSSTSFPSSTSLANISTNSYINNAAFKLTKYGTSTAIGSFDPLSNPGSYDQVYNYSIVYKDSSQNTVMVLKLAIPNSSLPTALSRAFASKVPGYNGIKDITDTYIDSDGDGIPDAWDGDPQYPDANANGILDGSESSGITFVSAPDSASNSSATNVGTMTFYPPILFDGSVNNPSSYSFTPPKSTVSLARYYDPTTKTTGLYFNVNGSLTRKVNYWSSLSQKVNFINGTVSGSKLVLSKSTELELLLSSPFSSNNRVQAEFSN